MTERDNIIDLVTQVDMAFLKRTEPWNAFDKYEAFAELVAAPLQERIQDLYRQLNEAERELDSQYKLGMEVEREACAKVRAKKPRELKPVGSGALLGEQQYCFDKGWKGGAASVRAAIRARGQA